MVSSESSTSKLNSNTILGHPAGLWNLFFTEMWERMSYYGMRAMLVLFMVDQIADGGLGLDDATATAIYGLYTASVYLVCLPGGWIADRLLGAQRSVIIGALVITAGHFVLAIPSVWSFFSGLCLVVLGTGLLKPNISAIVGNLYERDDPRRDGGFTIFYMGINLGGALGPIICSYLGESEQFGWHWGFAAAGVGMLFGVSQYIWGRSRLGDVGLHPKAPLEGQGRTRAWSVLALSLAALAVVFVLALNGSLQIDAVSMAKSTTAIIAAIFFAYFAFILIFGGLNSDQRKRTIVILVLCIAAAMFWSGFEQAGSSFNLFAQRYTDRHVFSFEFPAGWFQSINSIFIIILAPFFAAFWVLLAKRNLNPSSPAKFAYGLILLAIGFGVIMMASNLVVEGNQVVPYWLIMTYLFHTMGELCLSPVGLSAISGLAPKKYTGQMMGLWFLASSLGLIIAGLLAGEMNPDDVTQMPSLYKQIAITSLLSGIVLLLMAKPLHRWMQTNDEG